MIFSKKFVLPSVEVDWYEPSADFLAYVKEKWIDTGICTSFRTKTLDETQCILTITSEWDDSHDLDTILKDPKWEEEKDKEVAWNEGCEILLLEIKKGDQVIFEQGQ